MFIRAQKDMADEPKKQPQEEPKKPEEAPKSPVTPEKLEGKSTPELIKIYGDLEKKLGEQGQALGEAKKFQDEMAVVLQAIYANPEVKESVEEEMKKLMGVSAKKEEKKDGEVKKPSEERLAVESGIIKDFESRHGINLLPPEERKKVFTRIGAELGEMLDPAGNKSYAQVLDSVSLMKLDNMLERAYYLADREGTIKKAASEARAKVLANAEGQIGSLPASRGGGSAKTLSPEEKEVAKKLGVSEEDYLKNKT